MLEFPSHDGIEIYASKAGYICFKSTGELEYSESAVVYLTIGQFRAVIKNADALIDQAEWNKKNLGKEASHEANT